MNIFQQYGIKEVADVCLYAIELDENDDEVYVPVLYLDTLKVSTVEQTAESSSAQGGLGNPKLITWDYGKDISVTLEDALFTPASQGMMWGGKMGVKGLKLYLRNFWDRSTQMPTKEEINEIIEQHPEWSEMSEEDQNAYAFAWWLNNKTTGAVMTIESFSDFCIIPERSPSYENKANAKNQNTTGYVGGTSIYCWLVDATIVSNDGINKVALNDLILFYREQTQKWYFFNGKGGASWYKDQFSSKDVEHYAIGYQYGKETFSWIKNNLTVGDSGINGQKLSGELTAFTYLNQRSEIDLTVQSYTEGVATILWEKGVDSGTITTNIVFSYPISDKEYDLLKSYYSEATDETICAYAWLVGKGFGTVNKSTGEFIPKDGAPTSPGPYSTDPEVILNPSGGDFWVTRVGSRTIMIDDEKQDIGFYLRVSSNGGTVGTYEDLCTYIKNNYNFFVGMGNNVEYEEVAVETMENWNENAPCAKYNRGPDYEPIKLPLDFLTQTLYIDGFRKDKCARGLKYSDLIEEDMEMTIEPCRFETSIDIEYNTNIAPPQEAIYQIDHDLKDVFYLDRIEKCRATQRFCIDTDVNLKHGQCRYLEQYAQTPLTVFIDPKTMQPYEPNTFEYYRSNGQRITGNLRAFKQHEIYYKWTRTKAKEHQTLGSQIIVDATHFPGTYRLVGETYARSRTTGKDQRYQFEIPLCKMSAENNITLQAEGDPTTFTMKLTALRRFDGVMMKLTMYDIEDDKYCKNVSGSTKIVPQTSINPEVEDVNAPWSIYTEADYNLALDVSAPETIDLAELILDTKEGVAKTDGDD